MNNTSGKDNDIRLSEPEEELSADELVESLCRQISGLSSESEKAVAEETAAVEESPELQEMPKEEKEENIEDLILAMQREMDADENPVEEATAEESAGIEFPVFTEEAETEAVEVEIPAAAEVVEEKTLEIELPVSEVLQPEAVEEEMPVAVEIPAEAEVAEEEIPAEAEAAEEEIPAKAEAAEEEIPAEAEVSEEKVPAVVEVPGEIPAEAAESEEAFDEPDPGVTDVSAGVAAVNGGETVELPKLSAVPMSTKEQKKAAKKQAKEDKKRQKQEAEDEKARLKQEKKDLKRERKAEKKAKKKGGAVKIILFTLMLLIVAAAAVYLALSNRYKTVFYDGTKINGADCTGLTVEEAETLVARQMEVYDLTLRFRDNKKEVITGESIGFEYVSDGSVQEIMDSQIPVLWLSAFFEEYSYDASAACSYDEGKLNQVLLNLPECNLLNMTAPVDATIQFSETTKKFEIVPENPGTTFDLTAMVEAVEQEIMKGTREIDLDELGLYQEPAVKSDDPELSTKKDELNDIASASITYNLPNGETQVLDGNVLATWIQYDEAGKPYVDNEKWGENIANYVSDLAAKVNTSDSKLTFNTHNGGTVSLDNYLKGWLIDLEAEGHQLTEELVSRAVVTREPIYAQRAYSDENNGIGTTYVEVDLSQQYLWAIENGEVVIETPIVSGMMVPSRYTPEGVYPLNGKMAGRWLRGEQYEDGTYEYESWVDYWMPFNGGIGLHDASWRVDFGGSIYVGGGSHGCINMPGNKAAAVFDWITTGTPIICYYSAGYSLAPDPVE